MASFIPRIYMEAFDLAHKQQLKNDRDALFDSAAAKQATSTIEDIYFDIPHPSDTILNSITSSYLFMVALENRTLLSIYLMRYAFKVLQLGEEPTYTTFGPDKGWNRKLKFIYFVDQRVTKDDAFEILKAYYKDLLLQTFEMEGPYSPQPIGDATDLGRQLNIISEERNDRFAFKIGYDVRVRAERSRLQRDFSVKQPEKESSETKSEDEGETESEDEQTKAFSHNGSIGNRSGWSGAMSNKIQSGFAPSRKRKGNERLANFAALPRHLQASLALPSGLAAAAMATSNPQRNLDSTTTPHRSEEDTEAAISANTTQRHSNSTTIPGIIEKEIEPANDSASANTDDDSDSGWETAREDSMDEMSEGELSAASLD